MMSVEEFVIDAESGVGSTISKRLANVNGHQKPRSTASKCENVYALHNFGQSLVHKPAPASKRKAIESVEKATATYMYEDDYTINTNCVVGAIINKRLAKDGFQWQTSPTSDCENNKVIKSAWALCEEFESRYEKQFAEMCSSCNGYGVTGEFYLSVLNQLVNDDLHWGRVTGILTFAGAMSVHCMKAKHAEKIDLVREWTSQFIQRNVESWMLRNGGWDGLTHFYENPFTGHKESRWSVTSVCFHLSVGVLSGILLGVLIENRTVSK